MMTRSILQSFLPGVVIATGLALVIVLTGFLEQSRPPMPDGYGDTDLDMRGSRLKGFAFGMEGLAADWYYMRSLQYIGDKVVSSGDARVDIEDLRNLNPRLLHPLLENATDLDPHFVAAYNYGTVILPAIDPEKAIALGKKGVANNPNEWLLYQKLGYVLWRLGRYSEAADIYEKGSALGGASPFMKLMAAQIKSDGTTRGTFRAVYRDFLATSTDEQVREMSRRRLKELALADEREAIDQVLNDFKARNSRCANSFGEIGTMLLAVSLPEGGDFRADTSNRLIDPSGAPYLLDKQNCRVAADPTQPALPVK